MEFCKKIWNAYKIGKYIIDNLTELEDFEIENMQKRSYFCAEFLSTIHKFSYCDKNVWTMISKMK